MKKKLLITFFVLIMVCLFSVVASAANEVTLTNGTTADLTTVFKVTNNQVTGFNEGYTKESVTDVIFPDEIEGLEANFLFGEASNLNTITFAATDTFFISGDNIFSKCSVKKITFDPNCVVEIRKGNFSNCKSLTEITFPKFKVLTGSSFGYCENMVATNELILVEGLTEIGGHAFHDCKKLTGTVRFPSTLEKIQEYSFQNTGFENFDLSKCANLTLAGGGYGGPFTDNDSITSLDLSGCVSLTYLKNSFAANCDNLTSVILPPNLQTIESKALAHCYKLQSIVLPATLETIADEAFHSARKDQTIKTFTVYVQSNVQFGTTHYPFRDSSAKIEFVLVGDKVNTSSFIAANTYSAITGATVVDYLDPQSPWTYTTGTAITAHTIVENYCKPLALAGAHAFNGNPCVVSCEYCKLTTVKENPEHSEKATISYENGFDKLGTTIITCTNEGCTHKATEEAPALFVCLGYSAPMSDEMGIAIGFTINNEAVEEYRATGKSITFGVYAVAQQRLGENDIFDENGNATAGVINADLTSYSVDAFEIKIVGFNDTQKDIKLSLGAYVTEDGKTYSYMQSDKAGELVGNYYAVTYNSIIASLEANEVTQ